MKKFYITTTLPYVNAEPHIGFAAEIIKADVLARWRRLSGDEVFFNTGTDEHGQKIYEKARGKGKKPKEYCDEIVGGWKELKGALNLTYNSFIRTTDGRHVKAVQEFWKFCAAKGDIYKKKYKIKYCIGCELEKTESELVDGKCPLHPDKDLENIEEENYFFRFSKYQRPLLNLYEKNSDFVKPDWRFNEIKSFVKSGLEDFSISRLASKMPWGIPVPGDGKHVMYVWFDALVNYISCLGWPCACHGGIAGVNNDCDYCQFWPGTQVCGKDNLRQQTAMWQAMLMSAGLPNSKQILVFGFITENGRKISKSLGNVVSPYDLVKKYSVDAARFYLLSEIKPFADGDFSYEKFDTLYNAQLANSLGNLVARVSNLLEKNKIEVKIREGSDKKLINDFQAKMKDYKFDEALKVLWDKIGESDAILTAQKPWEMKDKNKIKKILAPVAQNILNISLLLWPFMPETAEKIKEQFTQKQIKKGVSLFPRIEK